jgi:hypothetical protein
VLRTDLHQGFRRRRAIGLRSSRILSGLCNGGGTGRDAEACEPDEISAIHSGGIIRPVSVSVACFRFPVSGFPFPVSGVS